MEKHNELIVNQLNMETNNLYLLIGNDLFGSAAFPPNPKKLVSIAEKWMKDKREVLANEICNNKTIITLKSKEDNIENRIMLVTAISDLIASIFIGVSPITVSVLLVKEGLDNICKEK